MTTPPEQIIVNCPRCGGPFRAWWQRSIDLREKDVGTDQLERMSTASCPRCGEKVKLGMQVIGPDGVQRRLA